jgi:hypothetical protein
MALDQLLIRCTTFPRPSKPPRYGGFLCIAVEINLELSQLAADLTVMLTEVDRIEAIAAGKTPADADEPWPSDRPKGKRP